jgi:hypothetical protein
MAGLDNGLSAEGCVRWHKHQHMCMWGLAEDAGARDSLSWSMTAAARLRALLLVGGLAGPAVAPQVQSLVSRHIRSSVRLTQATHHHQTMPVTSSHGHYCVPACLPPLAPACLWFLCFRLSLQVLQADDTPAAVVKREIILPGATASTAQHG